MTKDEIVKKNISLSFDFIRYLIKNPEIIDKVSDDSEIEFLLLICLCRCLLLKKV